MADAEDLVQSVAATFLEVMPRFESRSSVRTFLVGIMRRKAAELRRGARRIEHDEDALDGASFGSDGESDLERAKLGQVIHECIDLLPQKQRAAALLRIKPERETKEVGAGLGVSANYLGVLCTARVNICATASAATVLRHRRNRGTSTGFSTSGKK